MWIVPSAIVGLGLVAAAIWSRFFAE